MEQTNENTNEQKDLLIISTIKLIEDAIDELT